jgi:hypothetical protein
MRGYHTNDQYDLFIAKIRSNNRFYENKKAGPSLLSVEYAEDSDASAHGGNYINYNASF